MLGDKAFAIALLRHGLFDFSDMRRCAQALRQQATEDGGIAQSAIRKPNPELRQAAKKARKLEKDAKKWAMWMSQGWTCTPWQQEQILLLDTGELTNQVAKANVAYGFGQGSEKPLSREQAMILNVFSGKQLAEYMK